MLKRQIKWGLLCCFISALAACGYQTRKPADMPRHFQQVYFKSEHPYSLLSTSLKRQFVAMKVNLVKNKKNADFTFDMISSQFQYDNPGITTSNQAITLKYRLLLNFKITNKKGNAVFGPRTLIAAQDIILNGNQLFTSNISPLIKRQLDQRMSDLVFDQLTSDQAHKVLRN